MGRDTFDMFEPPERGRFGDNEQHRPGRGPKVNGASDLIDLTLTLREERPVSIAVSDPAKPGTKWTWLPKSQIEFEHGASGMVVVTMPEWLAKDKQLI
jgi:hypothetical protein